jgi:hypothetical protein
MIDVEYRVTDNGLIDAYAQLCDHAPDFVNAVTNRTVNDTSTELLADFQQEPGPVATPIQWTTPKQRRYVMAMKRKGVIASPYVRTHSVSKGWRVQVIYTPDELSSISLFNANEVTPFAEGMRQQPWMRNTGWLYAPDLAEKWQRILTDRIEDDLIKAWYAVEPGQNYA